MLTVTPRSCATLLVTRLSMIDDNAAPMTGRSQRVTTRYAYAFDETLDLDPAELTRLLGGKGANLSVMARDLGLPVPDGFTISTDACRAYLHGAWPAGLDDELRAHVARLGERVGRRFGDPEDPLLVSVRSGAPVSMPGMMDTILNVGLTSATIEGFARAVGDRDFAADCLTRLRAGYRQVIGEEPPDDPWQQLRAAIEAVFRSWNSDRAVAYRAREGIADDLGTAVTVQVMVFGNRGTDSGTGVLFTRNPSTGERVLFGDILFDAQGEDVVAGTHATQPLSVLAHRFPAVGAELAQHADRLERHYADLCDIEFTVEQGRLWMLQVRVGKRSPRAALRMAIDMAEDADFPCSRDDAVRRVAPLLAEPPRVFVRTDAAAPIATGLPASPGVASGEIATSAAAAEAAAREGRTMILVRAETSPEDVGGMAKSAGVLTARGGLASHAAVVARGWGIPAVVGAASVEPSDSGVSIGGRWFDAGDEISIDGSSGEIFAGHLAGGWQVAPEAATLLEWARESGVPIGASETTTGSASLGDGSSSSSTDDLVRALAIAGTLTDERLAETLLAGLDAVAAIIAEGVSAGIVERGADGTRLTADGRTRAEELFVADRAAYGDRRSGETLEAFHPFDQRVKQIVTAWQLRDVDGQQTFNDHTDPAYDASVLRDLATLQAEVVAWLAPLADVLPRFRGYGARLERAVGLAADGDQRYVASPRVDSYHTAWFELHEDLIRLAGRDRADEEAAGRA
jgi:pyruvate,orthophosphate dikinase